MRLTMQSPLAAFEKAYEAYTDRLHDEYYADDAPECSECNAWMDVTGDRSDGSATCPECGYSYSWCAPEPDDY